MTPLLLAVETATVATSVALLRGEEVLHEVPGAPGLPTAETLLPAIDALLALSGEPLEAVEVFAVSLGPGSFTSLRIGLATVKGLAFGDDRPAVAVPTLAALALAAPPGPGPAVGLLDARRGEVYGAAFGADGLEPDACLREGVYTPENLAAALPAVCRVVGEGVAICADALRSALGPGATWIEDDADAPRARYVGILGARLFRRGLAVDAASLVPHYVRRAQAEVVRTGEAYEAPGRVPS